MMKTKYTYMQFHIFEYKVLEAYLSRMAANGWMLVSLRANFPGFMQFQECERKNITFFVSYDVNYNVRGKNYTGEKEDEYIAFMEEYGYQFVCKNSNLLIFCSDDEQCEPIIEDTTESEKQLRSYVFRRQVMPWILIVLYFKLPQYVITRLPTLFSMGNTPVYEGEPVLPWILMNAIDLFLSMLAIFLLFEIFYRGIPIFIWLLTKKKMISARWIRLRGLFERSVGSLFILAMLVIMWHVNAVYTLVGVLIFIAVISLEIMTQRKNWHKGIGIMFSVLTVLVPVITFALLADYASASDEVHIEQTPFAIQEDIYPSLDFPFCTQEESIFQRNRSVNFSIRQQEPKGTLVTYRYTYTLYDIKNTLMKDYVVQQIIAYHEARLTKQEDGITYYEGKTEHILMDDHQLLIMPKQTEFAAINEIYTTAIFE